MRNKRLTDEQKKEILQRYCANQTCQSIADSFCIHNSTVSRIAKDAGKPMRSWTSYDKHWQEADLAYMAGIIDGEGSLCIIKTDDTRFNARLRYHIRMSITNTYEGLLLYVQQVFGGKMRIVKRTPRDHKRKQCYHWECSHRRAAAIVKAIQPYLIIKKAQAEIFLKFSSGMTRQYGRTGTPRWLHEQRTVLFNQIKELNRRGPKNALVSERCG